jgi:hypothetical protein
MTRSEEWEHARIRIVVENTLATGPDSATAALEEMLEDVRIPAEIIVSDRPGTEGMVAVSRDAALVFVPFRIHGGKFYHPYGGDVAEVLPELPITVLALAAQDIDLAAEPEEGTAADTAATKDRLARAVARLERREREAADAEAAAATAGARLQEARRDGEAADVIREIETEVAATKEQAETARRKADRAAAFHTALEEKETPDAEDDSREDAS